MLRTNKNKVVTLNTDALVFWGVEQCRNHFQLCTFMYFFSIHMYNFAVRKKIQKCRMQ